MKPQEGVAVLRTFARTLRYKVLCAVCVIDLCRRGGADVVMGLRIQLERQQAGNFPSLNEYAEFYGVSEKALSLASPNAIVMHPGPVNRGVELTSDVIDDDRSRIEDQVLSGVAVRMALLFLLGQYRKSAR